MKNVFAFAGERKSGKDYLADYLFDEYGVLRLSFSDEVRRISDFAFPWLDSFHVTPEDKDLPLQHPLNTFGLTPRQIWLLVGKLREQVEPGLFVRQFERFQLEKAIHCPHNLFVITDFRTPQEYDFLKAHNIPVIKIVREDRTGIDPCDFEDYIRNFSDYAALFTNKMDGTAAFHTFFEEFLCQQQIQ